ncbi:MAG: hypoxanthine phosphoribosyltransferase [Oscillospiraceae bacterium]|nr:hypoxanthine phosphoribosyltransferase [Oscillospiraceae bacterium]
MRESIKEVLFSKEEIDRRVKALGAQITLDYAGKNPILIGVLKGCYVFLADIARSIDLDCEIRFITASSYGISTISSGDVKIGMDFDFDISGRDVLIIEDILDSGVTLTALKKFILSREPASLKICTLLDKPARRQAQIEPDYLGFECPDEFVVGYGLDFAESYRNLPFVAILKPEVYE